MTSGGITLELVNEREGRIAGNGFLSVIPEELSTCKGDIELQFVGKKLDRKDLFGSSDPFLQFSRSNENGNFVVVHRTEHIKNTLNPVWAKFTLPIRALCNGDLDRSLKVECFDYNRSGNHSLIGEFYVTVRQLQMGPGEQNVYEAINPKKLMNYKNSGLLKNYKNYKKMNYKNSGLLQLIHTHTLRAFSFLDYIRGGTELACTFSIDFTQSNGNPTDPRSLHFFSGPGGGGLPNPYEAAINAVGHIIEDYDSDKLFPVLGFGARLPPDGGVSHCFYVNGHDSNPYCQGITGVLGAYRTCIRRIQLYGPTNFAPTVNHVADIARGFTNGEVFNSSVSRLNLRFSVAICRNC